MTKSDFTTDGNLPDGTVAVVVVAAGSGARLGHGRPKAFVEIGGSTLLELSQAIPLELGRPVWLVSVVPSDFVDKTGSLAAHGRIVDHLVVAGGSNRQESVAAGLAAIPAGIEFVLIHDAARALAPVELFSNVLGALEAGAQAAIPAIQVSDTIKLVAGQDGREVVVDTPDRAALRSVQTPQGFMLETLRNLHSNAATFDATDDAGLAEQAGLTVEVVAGSPEAFKVTSAQDLEYARFMLSSQGVRA